MWTASAHIITAVIGPAVLTLPWAIAQLGWIAGPAVMILLPLLTFYGSTLLSACYRSGDPVKGERNYTFMHAVHSYLGKIHAPNLMSYKQILGFLSNFHIFDLRFCGCVYPGAKKVKLCGLAQYVAVFGVCIGYSVQGSISMM